MIRVLAAVFVAVSLAACSGGTAATDANGRPLTTRTPGAAVGDVIRVVAAENVWGNIAEQIGGGHVDVTSIINDPNADPHTYETDPRDAAAVSASGIAILNGLGYDDFVSRLLDASPDGARTVINVAQVNRVGGDNPNPHLWYDPAYVTAGVTAIETAFIHRDPADRAFFTDHAASFLTSYQPYVDELGTIRAKYAGTKISYTERVPGYLVAAAGLVLGTPASFSQSVEDGNDPSPGDTATFNADLSARRVKLLLYNSQVSDQETDSLRALAATSGVPIVGVTETLPSGERFQDWQYSQAAAVYRALGG